MGQAKFYFEHLGADFSDYQQEDDTYKHAIHQTEVYLRQLGRVHVLQRNFLPNFIFGKSDIVVVLGQDGLVANTIKYLNDQPVLAINPDPDRWDGILLPFEVDDIPNVMPEVFKNSRNFKEITMAKAKLNNGQILCGVNDLFVGQKSHVSARYLLAIGNKKEQQSSSGIIVSTGLGSTGWLKSILTGAVSIADYVNSNRLKMNPKVDLSWNSDFLYFTVREPFPSVTSGTSLVFGKISNSNPMQITSQMPENGVI
ncbi:MAG: sugar kinase, partial [Burkholderiales bacterium]